MKSIQLKSLLLLLISVCFYTSAQTFAESNTQTLGKIKVVFNNEQLVVSLFDTPASRQLLAQLPLTLKFSDFASTEKIAYLPHKLNTANTPTAQAITSDFTYYRPWGNLAIFYKGFGSSNNLYVLGRIESGKEKIANIKQNFTATIECLTPCPMNTK